MGIEPLPQSLAEAIARDGAQRAGRRDPRRARLRLLPAQQAGSGRSTAARSPRSSWTATCPSCDPRPAPPAGRARYGALVSTSRGMTLAGRLASLGFADAQAAQRLITGGLASGRRADDELLAALAAAADPDAALAGLARLAATRYASRRDGLLAALHGDPALRARLIAVLGVEPGARRPPGPAPRALAGAGRPAGRDSRPPPSSAPLCSPRSARTRTRPSPPPTRPRRPAARTRSPPCARPTAARCSSSPPAT